MIIYSQSKDTYRLCGIIFTIGCSYIVIYVLVFFSVYSPVEIDPYHTSRIVYGNQTTGRFVDRSFMGKQFFASVFKSVSDNPVIVMLRIEENSLYAVRHFVVLWSISIRGRDRTDHCAVYLILDYSHGLNLIELWRIVVYIFDVETHRG